jgi:hypothetical protein
LDRALYRALQWLRELDAPPNTFPEGERMAMKKKAKKTAKKTKKTKRKSKR